MAAGSTTGVSSEEALRESLLLAGSRGYPFRSRGYGPGTTAELTHDETLRELETDKGAPRYHEAGDGPP